jgi:hypothetical protein
MRLRVICSLLLAIVGLQSHLHAASPVASVTFDGFVVDLPPAAEWRRIEGASRRAVFERSADGQRVSLSLSEQTMESLPEDKAFLRFAEGRQAELLSKLEMVSVHYNSISKKGALCLVYDGIYLDKADKVLPFLTFRGQLCRHPVSDKRLVQVELAQRSSTKEAAYKIDLLDLSEQVFNAAQFTEFPRGTVE